MIRPSALDLAQFCPGSAALGSDKGASRYAVLSSFWHAKCAGLTIKDWTLSPEELAEVDTWQSPPDCTLGDGTVLAYSDAYKEERVALNAQCQAVPADDDSQVIAGTPDFYWVVSPDPFTSVAYVADLKLSEHTKSANPNSLQTAAYGLAVASRAGCTHLARGIYHALQGTWNWGDMLDLSSPEATQLKERVLNLAQVQSVERVTGQHCSSCYNRTHCPEYLFPPELAETELKPFVEGNLLSADPEELGDLVLSCKRAKETVDLLEANLKEAVRLGTLVKDRKTGKVWSRSEVAGRVSLSKKKAEELLSEEQLASLMVQGRPSIRHIWKKAK